MKNILYVLLIAIVAIVCGFYFGRYIDGIYPDQGKKDHENVIVVQSDSMQLQWEKRIENLYDSILASIANTKTLTATKTIERYESIPKVVWLHDTLNIDTCKQSLVYYHTELEGCRTLVGEYKTQSKEKTKHIDQLEVELTKCGAARKKAEKKNKVKRVWGSIKNAGAGLLGWILGRNI